MTGFSAEAAAVPAGHDADCRVLRRLEIHEGACATGVDTATQVGIAIDVETSGLDAARHRVVELAVRRFRFDRHGLITKVDRAYSWLEDPGEPLDPAIVALTGLTDADLAGRSIDDQAVVALLRSADVVLAHNCAFDRKFVERRLPDCAGLAWACSLREVDWTARGFDGSGRSLGWMLAQCGWFHDSHRAGADVDALIAVLRHEDRAGRPALAELVETASRPGWRFRAVGAHFDAKDALKGRGYRWDADERVWWREVPDHGREPEAAWLAEHVYSPECRARLDAPAIDEVTWLTRHG